MVMVVLEMITCIFCNFLIAPVSLLYSSLKRVLNFVLRDVHIMETVPGNPSLVLLDCRVNNLHQITLPL